MDQSLPSAERTGMSFEDAVAAVVGELNTADAPKGEPAVEKPAVEVAPKATEAAAEQEKSEPAPESPPAPEPAPEMRALMDKEADLLAKQAAFDKFRAESDADLAKIRSRLDAYEADKAEFAKSPAARLRVIRALAPDFPIRELAEDIWFDELGESAPSTYLNKKVRALELEQEGKRKQEAERASREAEEIASKQAKAAWDQYANGLKVHASALDPSKNPLVKSLAQKNADLAVSMMLDAASMIAAREQRVPAPAEVADAVEVYLGQFNTVFSPAPNANPPAVAESKAKPASLRNEHTAIQPSRTVVDQTDPVTLRRNALLAAGLDPSLME